MDFAEASKFDLTASEWWDEAGLQQPLHAMNSVRVPMVKRALLGGGTEVKNDHTHPMEGLTVLDVGCGGGILSEVHLYLVLYSNLVERVFPLLAPSTTWSQRHWHRR